MNLIYWGINMRDYYLLGFLLISLFFICFGCVPAVIINNSYPEQVENAIISCENDCDKLENRDCTNLCTDLSHETWDAHLQNRDINFNKYIGE